MKLGVIKLASALLMVVIMFTAGSAISAPARAQESFGGSMIMFQVKNGTFRYLSVLGSDQYGQDQMWHTNWIAPTSNIISFGKQWTGFLYLRFYTDKGWRMCTVDDLRVGGSIALVRYYEGMGCSGGSNVALRAMTKQRLEQATLTSRDAAKVVGLLGYANDMLGCGQDIVNGLSSNTAYILLSDSCWGVVIEDLAQALSVSENRVRWAR